MREDRASSTAVLVALAVSDAERRARLGSGLDGERWTDLLLDANGGLAARLGRSGFGRALLALTEAATIPGLRRHFARRKRWIERAVRAELERGARRLVVVGAGLDALTLVLAPEYPAARFVEIDHPATQRAKRRLLEQHPEMAARVHLIAADLAKADLDQLFAALEGEAPTVFVVEGLLMYLEPASVEKLLAALARAPTARTLVFTFMDADLGGTPRFVPSTWLARAYLAWKGEPFRPAISASVLAEYIEPLGWRLGRLEKFQKPAGECAAIAARG